MPSRVTVRVTGSTGTDDLERLREDLADETGLDWREEPLPDGQRHLSAVESILTAVISGVTSGVTSVVVARGAEMNAEMAVGQAREVIKRWRGRWFNPPDAEVAVESLPGDSPGAEGPQGAEGPAGP